MISIKQHCDILIKLNLVSPGKLLRIYRVSVLKNTSKKLFLYRKMEFSREERNLVLAALKIRKKQEKISTDIHMQMQEVCVGNCHLIYFPVFVRIGLKFQIRKLGRST